MADQSGSDQLSGILNSLTQLFNQISAGQEADVRNANAAQANANNAAQTQSTERIQAARLALDTAVAKFNAAMSRVKTDQEGKLADAAVSNAASQAAKTTEDIQVSGQGRAQSAINFNQAQQDRSSQRRFASALAKGMALGLKQRALSTPLQPAQIPSLTTAPGVMPQPSYPGVR